MINLTIEIGSGFDLSVTVGKPSPQTNSGSTTASATAASSLDPDYTGAEGTAAVLEMESE